MSLAVEELTHRGPVAKLGHASGDWSIRPSWRIAARCAEPAGTETSCQRFDVYHGDRRAVWGLRDPAAATRWLERLRRAATSM